MQTRSDEGGGVESNEEALRRQRDDGLRREEHLAMLAHELRDPLLPILAAAEWILRHSPPGPVAQAAERILRQAHHQARLVDALLDTARVRRGQIGMKLEVLDLRRVVSDAVDATEPLRGDGLRLMLRLPPEPLWVIGDGERLLQCVVNLLTNAAKFTPPGGWNAVEAESEGARALVRVSDSGSGLSRELLGRIFQPFVQGAQTLDRPQGGLGLGLSLVRRLMELHQGGVRGDSAGPGQGAAFTLWLPLAAVQDLAPYGAAQIAPGPPRAVQAKIRRVLVVEDNDDSRAVLGELLQDEGFMVTTAADGRAGLEAALRERPDVLLTDLGLPGMDGYELAARVHQRCPQMRLVALSGYGDADCRQRAVQVGFDQYLIKPVDARTLLDALCPMPMSA